MAENNTRAWVAVLTKGSASLKKKLTLKHGDKPEFQRILKSTGQDKETWYKMHQRKQARLRGEDPTTKEKERKQIGLKAWGATKGTRMGGEEGGGLTTDAPKAGKAVVGQYAGAGPVKTLSVAEYMKQKEEEQRREKARAILAARKKMNEEKDVQHLIGITVSHPELKSAEPILKKARVRASSEEEAIKKVKSHYRKAGYKVHDAYHHSTLTFNKKVDEGIEEACWKGYKAVGKKMKNGRVVPNCVPVKEESVDEAATSDNTGYGKGYHGNIGGDDKKYSSMHTKVKRLVGAAGHLSDVKKPNVMVKHFLDSKHGRHIADQPSDSNITSRFKKFKKTYNPEMHEETQQMDESHKVGDLVSYYHDRLRDHVYGIVQSVHDDHITMKTGGQTRAVPMKMVQKADKNKVPKYRYMNESEQMEEGTVDLTKTLVKKIKAKGDTAYRSKKTGLLTLRKKSVKEEAEQIDEAGFKLSRRSSGKYREHKFEHDTEERMKNRPSYQGYHTQIHVDGRHYKAGDKTGGEKGAQEAARHASNIAKKTGKKVSIHMIHHETGKTLAIADHDNGNWSYRNMNEGYKEDIKAAPFDTKGARKTKKVYKDKYGNVVKNIAKHLAKKGMAAAMKEDAEQVAERNDMWHPDPKIDSKMGGRAAAIMQKKKPTTDKHLELLKRLASAGKRIAAEEVEQIAERAKWRSSSAAKPDPEHDWDRSSKSTGGMRASSDTRGDTGGEYNHSSLQNRRKAQVVAKTGKTTKASNISLKNRIRANMAQKQNKPHLPEEVEQIDEIEGKTLAKVSSALGLYSKVRKLGANRELRNKYPALKSHEIAGRAKDYDNMGTVVASDTPADAGHLKSIDRAALRYHRLSKGKPPFKSSFGNLDKSIPRSDKDWYGKEKTPQKKLKVEEVEQVDEKLEREGPVRPDLDKMFARMPRGKVAQAYAAKKAAERDAMNKANDPGADRKGLALSVTDTVKAIKKGYKKGVDNPVKQSLVGKKGFNEDVEQIDELKRDTLISYVGKARAKNIKDSAKNRLAGMETSLSDMDKASAKTSKRSKGIGRAYARLNKEEVEQIDEISNRAKHAYMGSAVADLTSRSLEHGAMSGKRGYRGSDFAKYQGRKIMNRQMGIARVADTLVKKMAEGLDKVGKETADIDNDKDVDKTDMYLHNRRGAIKKAIAKKKLNEGKAAAAADKAIALQRGKGNKINRKPTMEVDLKSQPSPEPTHSDEDNSANVKV